MIRQQNVSSCVKPRFDQFSSPSLSLALEEMVELCAREGKESIQVHLYSHNVLFYVRTLREEKV